MKTHNYCLRAAGMILLAAAFLAQPLRAAVTFAITPAAVSNTYNGYITLQIGGLTSGTTVVIQKYLDANTNGVVDAGDLLVEQGNLTDGKPGIVIGGATNINVPGDADGTTNGAITSYFNFGNGDFIQSTVGKYLFVLSSTNGAFMPITNAFSVTNLPYGQQITGTVTNSSGAAVPNALVILFPPPRPGHDDPGSPVAAVMANNSGVYSIKLPPGSGVPLAFRSNYVGNYATSPLVTVNSGQTVTTNLTLSNATTSVSGSYVDSTNSGKGLPGVFLPVQTSGGLLAGNFTDTNGNFNVPVSAGQSWSIGSDSRGLVVHGYVGYNNTPTNVSSGATGVTVAFPKATALFYGTVLDSFGNPLPGIDIDVNDLNSNVFQMDYYSDTNGNYAAGLVGGLGANDPWQLQIGNGLNPAASNYVFSTASAPQNGGVNMSAGQALQANVVAIFGSNQITGHVLDTNGNPIVGLQIFGLATIQGTNYFPLAGITDSNGFYRFNVPNASWQISVNYCCGNNTLSSFGNYEQPPNDNVTISNNNGTANFTVQPCNGVQISTASLPAAQVNSYYDFFLQGSTCTGNPTWTVNDPQDFPSELNFGFNGEIYGTPSSSGTYNFSVNLSDGDGNSTNQSLSLTINPATAQLQVTTVSLPNGTNGAAYNQTLQASGGQTPYTWSLEPGSASLPSNLTLGTNGVISGTATVSGTNFEFIVQVTDAVEDVATQTLALTIGSSPNPPALPLTLVRQSGNGLLEFTFNSAPGVNYSVQTSTDLIHWTTILSFTGEGGQETISAPTTNGAKMFYRMMIP